MILHHYDSSPYAEKVRLMFGLANMAWRSQLAPIQPPRPTLDQLAGGYRRIPVAQLGADIFCDTSLIAKEIAALGPCPALDIEDALPPAVAQLMAHAEQDVFFAAIGAVSPLRLLGTLVLRLGPMGAAQFIKDRAGLMSGGTARPVKGPQAKALFEAFLANLDKQLANQDWIGGDTATIADLAIYHPLWLHASCDRRPLRCGPNVDTWYQRVTAIGHGLRQEIAADTALAAAADASPRPLPDSVDNPPVRLGSEVEVAPSDYGIRPVKGVLAAVTETRFIVARQTPELGPVHVHFPRAGYRLAACR